MSRPVRVAAAATTAIGLGVVASAFALGASADAVFAKTAQVYIIQGVPGASVDVDVDGDSVGSDVAAKAIVGPLSLSHGTHDVTFTGDDWTISTSVSVSKASTDVVLHWPADATDEPEATVFANDVAAVAAGKARLTVAHTAVVPPADIVADGNVLFSNIANGEFVTAEVPADTYKVAVVPTGQQGDALLGPLDLPVAAGKLTRVFAIGEPENGSMDAVVQVLPVAKAGSPAPSSVQAGEAGLAAGIPPTAGRSDQAPIAPGMWALVAVVLTGAIAFVGMKVRQRAR